MAQPGKPAPESPAAPFAPEVLDALIGDARTPPPPYRPSASPPVRPSVRPSSITSRRNAYLNATSRR